MTINSFLTAATYGDDVRLPESKMETRAVCL